MKTSFQPEPCFQVNVFSSSILPGGEVGASYRKVKWRTPGKAHIAGNARNKLDSVNFFIEGAARLSPVGEAVGFPIRLPRVLRLSPLEQALRSPDCRRNVAPHSRN